MQINPVFGSDATAAHSAPEARRTVAAILDDAAADAIANTLLSGRDGRPRGASREVRP
jgi:hypothetical protein